MVAGAWVVVFTWCILSVAGQCIQTQAGPIDLDGFVGNCPSGLVLTSTGDAVTVSNCDITAPFITINAATNFRIERSTVTATGVWTLTAGDSSTLFLSTLVYSDRLSITTTSTSQAALILNQATFVPSGAGLLALDLTSLTTGLLVLSSTVFPSLEATVASEGVGIDTTTPVAFTGLVRLNITTPASDSVFAGFRSQSSLVFTNVPAGSFINVQNFYRTLDWSTEPINMTDTQLVLDVRGSCECYPFAATKISRLVRSSITVNHRVYGSGGCAGTLLLGTLVAEEGTGVLVDSVHEGPTTGSLSFESLQASGGSSMALRSLSPRGTAISMSSPGVTVRTIVADPAVDSVLLEGTGLTGIYLENQVYNATVRATGISTTTAIPTGLVLSGVQFTTLDGCDVVATAQATGPATEVRGCFITGSSGQLGSIVDTTMVCNGTGPNAGLVQGARIDRPMTISGLTLDGHCPQPGCMGVRMSTLWTSSGPAVITTSSYVSGPGAGFTFVTRNDASTLTLRTDALETPGTPSPGLLRAGTLLDIDRLNNSPINSNGCSFDLDAPTALYRAPWTCAQGLMSFTGSHTFQGDLQGANLTIVASSRALFQQDVVAPAVSGGGALVLDRTLVNGVTPPVGQLGDLTLNNVRLQLDGTLGGSSDRFEVARANNALSGRVFDDATSQLLVDGGTFNTNPVLFSRFFSAPERLVVFTSTAPTTVPDEATVLCDGLSCQACVNVLDNDVHAFSMVAGDLVTPAGREGDFTLDAGGLLCYSRAGPVVVGDYPLVVTYQAEDGPPGEKSPPTAVSFDLPPPTPTATASTTSSLSPTPSLSGTSSDSPTPSSSASPTISTSPTSSASETASSSITPSGSASPTSSASQSPSSSITPSVSATPTSSASQTGSSSVSPTISTSPTSSLSVGASPSVSLTPSGSLSLTSSPSVSLSSGASSTRSGSPSSSLSEGASRSAFPRPPSQPVSSSSSSSSGSPSPSHLGPVLLPPLPVNPTSRPTAPPSPTWGGPIRSDLPSPTPLYTPLPPRLVDLIPDCYQNNNNNEVFCNGTLIINTDVRTATGQPIQISRPDVAVVQDSVGVGEVDSPIINVTLADGGTGPLGSKVEICLKAFDTSRQHCLGFLDESRDPPEWRCEDRCVHLNKGLKCGNTGHFTAFALLLTIELPHGRDPCSAFTGYVTGSPYGDLILILSTVALMVCVCVCLCVAVTNIPYVRMLLLGSEGDRIARSRIARSNMSKWLVKDAESDSNSDSNSDSLHDSSRLIPPA